MDGTTFDALVKRIATTRLTRVQALRGLAATGVAALTGVAISTDEAGADRKNRDEPKRRVCVCSSCDPNTCDTKKKPKSRVKRILRRNACAYRGRCQPGKSGCVCGSLPAVAVACNDESNVNQCSGGQICINGRCQGGESCVNPDPNDPNDVDPCPDPLECREHGGTGTSGVFTCLLGGSQGSPGQGSCPPRSDDTCPAVDNDTIQTICVLSRCLRPCDSDAECEEVDQGSCRSGFCIRANP